MLLVVGNAATVDGIFKAASIPTSEMVGVLDARSADWLPGGSAMAIALAAVRHVPVRLWHPLPGPQEQVSRQLLKRLREGGVDITHCPSADRVVRALIVEHPDGRLAWSQPAQECIPTAEELDEMFEGVSGIVFSPRWGSWSEAIATRARLQGVPMSYVGEVPPQDYPWAIGVADARQHAASTPKALVLVSTEGARGALVTGPGERFHVPACNADLVDTTGAGDVFGGTLIGLRSAGHSLREAASGAAAAAAAQCEVLGALPVASNHQT